MKDSGISPTTGSELPELPVDEMSSETPHTDPAVAIAALDAADPEPAPGGDTADADGPTGPASAREPDVAVAPAQPGKKKPGPPKGAARARGDARLSATQLKDLRKDELLSILKVRDQDLQAARERIEDLAGKAQIASSIQGELINESITEAVAATIDVVGNFAEMQFGPACRVTKEDHEKLDLPWTRVAKMYLGQHSQYSPLAAALLATVSVAAEKYVAVKTGPQLALVKSDAAAK